MNAEILQAQLDVLSAQKVLVAKQFTLQNENLDAEIAKLQALLARAQQPQG